jgi:hypothetical protein
LLRGHHKRKEQEGKERAVQGGNGWYNASVRRREEKRASDRLYKGQAGKRRASPGSNGKESEK